MMPQYSFHIEFEDGSNPFYHFPCTPKVHKKALAMWKEIYDLELIKVNGTIEFYKAKEKKQ